MEIITAEQAREVTENYIPLKMKGTLEFVMEKIKEAAKNGECYVEFNDFYSVCDYEMIRSENFRKYIESFGYFYEVIVEEHRWGDNSERVKISW